MSKKYIVVQEFADKNDFRKRYNPGDELPGEFDTDGNRTGFDKNRLEKIVKLGLAKIEDDMPVTDIDLTGKASDIIAQVQVFEDVEKLKQYLETENATDKPRKTVVDAIEARLANIIKE